MLCASSDGCNNEGRRRRAEPPPPPEAIVLSTREAIELSPRAQPNMASPVVFQPFRFREAVVYHLVYHFSFGMHVNHLIFLPMYLVGVFVLAGLVWPPWLCIALAALLALYSTGLAGVLLGVSFAVIVELPAVLLANYARSEWGGGTLGGVGILGLGTMLGAFALQLIGHAAFEDIQASPNLMHGFVSAPILEWACMWLRLRRWYAGPPGRGAKWANGVWDEVLVVREALLKAKAAREDSNTAQKERLTTAEGTSRT